jgi:hypothetical protein
MTILPDLEVLEGFPEMTYSWKIPAYKKASCGTFLMRMMSYADHIFLVHLSHKTYLKTVDRGNAGRSETQIAGTESF